MSTKDWILLLVPIFCNGIIVFLLQRAFERRQLIQNAKYKYVETMQKKVDDALEAFGNVVQSNGNDMIQIGHANTFVNNYCSVFYYYQQNHTVFRKLDKDMEELLKLHEQLQKEQHRVDEPNDEVIARKNMEALFRKIYELLQSMQNKCIQRKI